MNHTKNATQELINIQNFVQMLLTLLNHTQDAQTDEVVPASKQSKLLINSQLLIAALDETNLKNITLKMFWFSFNMKIDLHSP